LYKLVARTPERFPHIMMRAVEKALRVVPTTLSLLQARRGLAEAKIPVPSIVAKYKTAGFDGSTVARRMKPTIAITHAMMLWKNRSFKRSDVCDIITVKIRPKAYTGTVRS